MASYVTRVKRDIGRWVEGGLIDAATATALSSDVERNAASRLSLGSVLSMMAAALFAAAILIFIAANWEAMPRLVRVSLLFFTIAAGYVGGAALKLRGQDMFGETAWIIAATAFGASIALIAQMYHMSGDERQAILVWCAGTGLAAGALRSSPLTVGAVLLLVAWLLMHVGIAWRPGVLPLTYPLAAAALYALSFWTQSAAARHLLILSLALFAALHFSSEDSFAAPALLLGASVALLAADRMFPAETERVLGLGGAVAVHALVWFLTAIGIFQLELVDDPEFALPSAAALLGIVTVLLLKGRESALLRWLAYAAFVFQLCFVYVVMLGTMLGTAGFFVVGGATLSVLAWVITRLERRFSAPATMGGAS